MADNAAAEAVVTPGETFALAELTFSGDTVKMPGCFVGIMSGSEGSWTFSLIVGGAGAVGAGVQRVTLASDDPAVALLGTIDADTGNAVTSLQLLDDVIKTDDAAFTPETDKVAMVGAEFNNSTPNSVDEGDAGALRMSANRNLFIQIRDAAGNERGANVDNSSRLLVFNTPDGSTVQPVVGAVQHDEVASNGPLLNGGYASTLAPTDVSADGDLVRAWYLRHGAAMVAISSPSGSVIAGDSTFGLDADVTRVVPGTSATHLGKAEDAAHSSGATGVYMLAVRDDSLAAHSDTDGDYESLHTNANGALWTVDVNSATIAGAVSGTEMQVDVVGALPAGTNNIGDVDVASIVPGTGATNLGKAEDAVHASGDVGVMMLAVRQDSQADLAADGDYMPPTIDADGGLRVSVVAGSAAGTQYTEDAAAAADPVGNALIMVRDDALSAQTSADGDNIAARGTDKGELYVKHVDAIPVTDNGGAITVDNGGTFAVQAVCTNAGTFATQAVCTNAGTFAVQVDGSALTALQLIDDVIATLGTTTYTEAATKGAIIGAVRRDADTTLVDTTNEIGPLQMDANGRLKVEIFDGGDSHTIDYATTGSGTATGALRVELPTNGTGVIATVGAVTAITNALPAGTNAIGKLAANTGVDIGDVDVTSIVPGTGASNLGKAEDAAHTTGDVGVMALGVRAAAPTERSAGPTDGDYEPFGLNEVGAIWMTDTGSANGGLSTFRSIDLDETEEDVKTSAGTVYHIVAFNRTAAPLYLRLYNATAASTTVGSTTPLVTFVVPANADSDGAGFVLPVNKGIKFDTACCAAVTTGVSDADAGAPGANDCVCNIFYK